MEKPDDLLPDNLQIEALQQRCFRVYVLMMLFNTILATLLMWDLLNMLPLGFFLGAISLAHLVGLIISARTPMVKLKPIITVIIIVSVIIISPVAVISHIFGNRGNYLWIALAPMATMVLYPEIKPSRMIIFFCSSVFLMGMLMAIGSSLIPVFHLYLQDWYLHIAKHTLSTREKIAIMHPTLAVPIFFFYFLYYIQKISEAKIIAAYDTAVTGQFSKDEELSAARYAEIFASIEDYFRKSKPYLDPAFSIAQLARHLNSNTTYISRAISIHNGMSFTTYINTYRVRHAKDMIKHNSNEYTLEYIYTSSGFKNQSTFNRVFKQMEGVTPSEFFGEF
ncbi:MAG: helix-turn-helix transcriptional regulator [Tannerellaceae bacterium]|jgi:AraC-like DNA-binding protein|nr:helix-turn-helix transcriptional regulator [Tannerellaceae bacterium]